MCIAFPHAHRHHFSLTLTFTHSQAEDSWYHSKVIVELWRRRSEKSILASDRQTTQELGWKEKQKTGGRKTITMTETRKEMSMAIDSFSTFLSSRGKSDWWNWTGAAAVKVELKWKRSRSTYFWFFYCRLGTHFRLRGPSVMAVTVLKNPVYITLCINYVL